MIYRIKQFIKGEGKATRIPNSWQRYAIPAFLVGGIVGLLTINLFRKNRGN